jgi:hypothetical protein
MRMHMRTNYRSQSQGLFSQKAFPYHETGRLTATRNYQVYVGVSLNDAEVVAQITTVASICCCKHAPSFRHLR